VVVDFGIYDTDPETMPENSTWYDDRDDWAELQRCCQFVCIAETGLNMYLNQSKMNCLIFV